MKTTDKMKFTNKQKTAAEEFPELDMLAEVIAQAIIVEINNNIRDNIGLIRTECMYPIACTRELVIKKLQEKV